MQSISSIAILLPTDTIKSRRAECIRTLYELYTSQPEKTIKENRRRYHEWVRLHHPEVCRKHGFSKDLYNSHKSEFKSAKLPKEQKYLKPLDVRLFCIRLSHLDEDTLNYMISVARDKLHRNENVGAYILGSIKAYE